MKPIRCTTFFLSLALFLVLALPAQAVRAERHDFTFFQGTQYPLTVAFLKGAGDGPTIMVQGGIQGDESSGFITAQLLSLAHVRKGNLIVVPRANVPSIHVHKRQVNVDMNRRFDQEYNRFYEDRVARVIRYLLGRSDALVHLHEGSGFYDPVWKSAMRNPKRYGQSIIIDTLTFGKLHLGNTANEVLKEVNADIADPDYHFRLFNTKTFVPGTDYPEMRKSLTCYALSACNIPAFAVEVSKDIRQIGWKVNQQLKTTVHLLRKLGVDVDLPVFTDDEIATYAARDVRVRVNGHELRAGQPLNIVPGATLKVDADDEGNQLRPALGVFASDRPGVNLLTARRMVLEPFTTLELRSDGSRILDAPVHLSAPMPAAPKSSGPVFVCWLNGNPLFVRAGETLDAVIGDQLILEGVWGSNRNEILNLKGFVANTVDNDGQDSGWEIILDPDNFISRYLEKSPDNDALRMRVARETPHEKHAEFFIDVHPRQVHALRLADATGRRFLVPWTADGDYRLPEGEYTYVDAWTNGAVDKLIPIADSTPLSPGQRFRVTHGERTPLQLHSATTFAPMGTMTFTPSTFAMREDPAQLTR